VSRHGSVVALWLIVVAYGAFGLGFIERTGFDSPDGRVYCLWDDAMISMQYARNLAEGHGLVWNAGGARVQGISNPAVAFVMAGLHWLPLGERALPLAFQLLNLAVLLLVLVLSFDLARLLVPERLDVRVGAVAATALAGPLALWSLRGSDMGFVTLWLLVGVHGLARAEAGRRVRLGLLLAALGPGLLIRPDVVLYYGLLIGAAALAGERRAASIGTAVAGLVLGGWLVFAWIYYGDPLPNTYYLKATGHPRALVLAKGAELLGWWIPYLLVPLAFAAVALWVGRRKTVHRLCGAIIVASIGYSFWVGGDWMAPHGIRYMVPMLPLLSILMVEGVAQSADRLVRGRPQAARFASWGVVTAACALGVLANPPAARAEWLRLEEPMLLSYNRSNYFLALYLARHTEPSTSIGVRWAGAPIYFSRRPGVDLLGKSDRHIARLSVDRFRPGHSKWDWDYVMNELRPDVFADRNDALVDRADFRRQYLRVAKGDRYFYLHRGSLSKLRDRSVRLFDLETGRETTRAEVEASVR